MQSIFKVISDPWHGVSSLTVYVLRQCFALAESIPYRPLKYVLVNFIDSDFTQLQVRFSQLAEQKFSHATFCL